MTNSIDLSHLQQHEWDQLNEVTSQLEDSWENGEGTDLAALLPPGQSRLRRTFLLELIRTELEIRYRKGRPQLLEVYLQAFPELGPVEEIPADLVFEEYRVRRLYGDRPGLSVYQARFPRQFPRVERRARQLSLTDKEPTSEDPTPPRTSPTLATSGPDSTPASQRTLNPIAPLTPPSLDPTGSMPSSRASAKNMIPVGGGYEILEKLGSGQFGEVLKARAPGGIAVAIKRIFRTLDSESGQREKEALEVMTKLSHPFLLQMHAYWPMEDRLYIVMELAEDSLFDWFKANHKAGVIGIPADELLPYFQEAAEALDYLHSQHVLHRDIKPANLLRLKGHAKVADFGLAKLQQERLAEATFCGTPLYMPPEMWRSQVSIHSDQYSLALTYIELCTGSRPFSGKDQFELGRQHLMGEPELKGFNPAETKVLKQALAKDPEQRYPSCSAFIQALSEAHFPRPVADESTKRLRSSAVWLVPLLLLLLLGGVAATLSLWWPNGNTTQPWLPEGFQPAKEAKVENGYYKKIEYRFANAPNVDPVVLVLISRSKTSNLPTFYMGENLVTYGQFAQAWKDPRMQELLAKYSKGANAWVVQRKWPDNPEAKNDPRLPVVWVTATEAHCFAELLGGSLPSGDQWDKAGGRFDKQPGPFKPWAFKPGFEPKGIALNLKTFQPVGKSPGDESLFGCFDMAGNCREFTRDVSLGGVALGKEEKVPLEQPKPGGLEEGGHTVFLRGRSIDAVEPFTFDLLNDPFSGYPERLGYGEARRDVGFRIVIESPVTP